MSLHKKLNDLTPPEGDLVEQMLAKMDEETGTALRRLLLDSRVSTRKIHSTLREEGIKIGRETIDRHRQKLRQ